MKTEREELKLQVYALKKLGFSAEGAAKMVARGAIARQKRLEKAEILKIKIKKPAVTHLLKLKKSLPSARLTVEVEPQDKADMQKSTTRLEKLLAVAQQDPAKLTAGTRQAVNAHLDKQNRPQITVPVPAQPWFRQPTLGEVATRREAIAANAPPVHVPVAGPSLADARMTTQQLQQHRLDQARQMEAAQKETPAVENRGIVANFIHF